MLQSMDHIFKGRGGRACFFYMFASSICIFIFWKLKGEWADAKGEKFDLIGSVIFGLALMAFMYGLSELPAIWAASLVSL
jgi:sugar phosphate permease